MARLSLFEFQDQKWVPSFLRNYETDFLRYLSNNNKIYKQVIPIIKKGLEKSRTKQIIDLGSGGGGGLIWLYSDLKEIMPELKVTLTDYYPNISAFEFATSQVNNLEFLKEPIDARKVPINLVGLRTQFLSFHHFNENDAKQILQNAISSDNPIAIFELYERSVYNIAKMLFSPLSVLFATPFIRPFKIGRIVFTYLIPVVPLFVVWDGIVSVLRTYTVQEMECLIEDLSESEQYNWEIGKKKSGHRAILYLLGTKKET